MNWQFITKTSPGYWRYQGIVLAVATVFMLFSIWSMNHIDHHESVYHLLSVSQRVMIITYQMIFSFAIFHVFCRGFYKYFKRKNPKKLMGFVLLSLNALLATLIAMVFDFLPIWLKLVPYDVSHYLKSIIYADSLQSNLTGYLFSNGLTYFFWLIVYGFAAGSANYKRLIKLNKKQELTLLANRINPEFLFNTMDTIKNTIDQDEEKAADLITRASELFRYNLLSSKKNSASLSEEVESLKNFLVISEMQQQTPEELTLDMKDEQTQLPGMSLILLVSFILKTARQKSAPLLINGYKFNNSYRIDIYQQSYSKWLLDNEYFDIVNQRIYELYQNNAQLSLTHKGRSRKLRLEIPLGH